MMNPEERFKIFDRAYNDFDLQPLVGSQLKNFFVEDFHPRCMR